MTHYFHKLCCVDRTPKNMYSELPGVLVFCNGFFQAILMLNQDVCERILLTEAYRVGNIFHLAARYGYSLQVQ